MAPPDPGWHPAPHDGILARSWGGTKWSCASRPAAALAQSIIGPKPAQPRRPIDDGIGRFAFVVQLREAPVVS